MRKTWGLIGVVTLWTGVAFAQTREELAIEAFPVLEKGCRSGDMSVRARSVEAMARIVGRDVSAYLQDGLADAQWVVRVAALKAMARLGRSEARRLAADWLRMPDFPAEFAFSLLGAFPAGDAKDLLSSVLQDPAAPTRSAVFAALVHQDPAVVAPAVSAGLAKGDAFFREHLSDIPEENRPAVAQALLRDRNPAVQAAALDWIRTQGIAWEEADLRALLKSANAEVRLLASELLARRGDGTALQGLLPLLEGSHDQKIRFLEAAAAAQNLPASIADRLKRFLAPETPEDLLIPVYLAFAGTTDETLRSRIEEDIRSTLLPRRAAATRALARLMGLRALPKLYELLQDGNPMIRRLAAEGIADLGQAESVEVLERALRDTERDVRLAVVRALGRIRDRSVAGVASFVVYDPDPEIRKAAILAVCQVQHADALPLLRIHAEDPDPQIRFAVLQALIALDPATAREVLDRSLAGLEPRHVFALTRTFGDAMLPFLKVAASSSRAWTRLAAVSAVRFLPAHEIAFLEESAATSPHPDVRKEAVMRLADRSCASALAPAMALVKDPSFEVRAAAAEVLTRCGDNAAIGVLRELLLDPEEVVRVTAATGLLAFPRDARPPKGKRK